MNEMEVISHLNVSVGLFPFTKILNLNIDHGPNVFGLCTIVGEMDHESADEIAQRTDESSETEVVTTASGQPARLFCGVVKNVSVNHQNEYAKVTVVLEGTCKKLDIQTHQRSYQDTTATYGDLIRKSISGEGTAEITVTDKQTGQLIVQYDETNWDFCIRMASQLGAPVFSDVQADEPHLYVGLPPSDQVKDLSTAEFQMAKSTMSNQMQTGKIVVSEDASDAGLKSYCYVFAGNFVKVDARFYAVKSISAEMKDGILEMNYGLLPMGNEAPTAGATTDVKGLAVSAGMNQNCSGKMAQSRTCPEVRCRCSSLSIQNLAVITGLNIPPHTLHRIRVDGTVCLRWEIQYVFFSRLEMKARRLHPVPLRALWGRALKIRSGWLTASVSS